MPSLTNILGNAIGSAISFILGQSAASSDQQQLQDDLTTIAKLVQWIVGVVAGLWDELLVAMNNEGPKIYNTGAALGAIGGDWGTAVTHLTDVVLPASFRWLEGDIVTRYIDPLKGGKSSQDKQINDLIASLAALTRRVEAIEDWRDGSARPLITKATAFMNLWNTWPATTVARMYGYFTHPTTFSDWATPIVWQPIVDDMSGNASNAHMDTLERVLIDYWPAHANAVDVALQGVWNTPVN